MAINRDEYINKIEVGLKANKSYTKFFLRFKLNAKSYYQIFDYSDKNWDKRTRISKAKSDSFNFKQSKKDTSLDIDEDIKFDKFINKYFDTKETSNSYSGDRWLKENKNYYQRHIKSIIGNKKIKDIRQINIKDIISNVKQLGLKERTQKTTLEILNPVFKSAIANRIIIHNPCDGIKIKRPNTKKKVQNASILLKEIYNAIITVFKDDIYYQALFLFALQGRRRSEILTLRWEYIDFDNMLYTLPNTKNGEEQTFILPESIALLLLAMQTNKKHYVFESPTDSTSYIQNIQTQTRKLKKALNNPNFGIHYLRNVVVSAMAEQGVNATYLSGALGHSDLNTIKKYLSIPYKKGSEVANATIDNITKNRN
ncbi:tyrosine-type recombinase/integrase [Arcobacter sp. KX21116]|uniref:tyrosine-type recombinase/integrase n=1 Tax=Arcobacter iocasae TaxID=2906515 RepID=UPI0035D3E12B